MIDNHNNNRLFYVTVFITALFVAVLSATFAYFQASAVNNSTVTGQIIDTTITLSVNKLPPTSSINAAPNGTSLIPFDLIGTSNTFNTSSLTSAISSGCIDDDDYNACDVYKITVKANNTMNVNGYIKIEAGSNSTIPNVKWMLLKAKSTSNYTNIAALNGNLTTSYLTYGNVKPIGVTSTTNLGNTTDGYYFTNLSSNDQVINSSNSYYYFVVWLEDINDLQDDEGTYKGTVTFRGKGSNSEQITANFSG